MVSLLRSLAAIIAAACLTPGADAWVAPIIAKGNKFFNSVTGEEFRLKGIAYAPRPNAGKYAEVSNVDWFADVHEKVWKPHLAVMKDLGVNTIRLYSVDPSLPHDKFMCACSEAGIYVLVGLAAPCESCAIIDEPPPKCYPDTLFARAQLIYNTFAAYDNTLGFSVGNEHNFLVKYSENGTTSAPCVKAFLRDTRSYAASCSGSLRQVPIGLDIADTLPRSQWLQYYDCALEEDEHTRAEWIGFNPYVECDPLEHTTYAQSTGLQELMQDFADAEYARPLMLGEFGCNKGANTLEGFEKQRSFYDAKWMNDEQEMTDEVVGGNAFEFTTEIFNLQFAKKITKAEDPNRYGVGYFTPESCDHDTVPCVFTPYPEYANLKKAYTTTPKSTLTLSSYKIQRDAILTCPKGFDLTLPPTPKLPVNLDCLATQPLCNGKKSNAGEKEPSVLKVGDKKAPSNPPAETTTAPKRPRRNFTTPSGSAGSGSGPSVMTPEVTGPSAGTLTPANGASGALGMSVAAAAAMISVVTAF